MHRAVVAALLGSGYWAAHASAYIYWGNADGGAVGRAKLDGAGIRERFISSLNHPFGVAVDAHYIYWTDYVAGTIERANLDGTGVDSTFITGANGPTAIALGRNGAYIYWTDNAHRSPHHRHRRLIGPSIARADLDGADPDQRFIALHPYGAWTLALSTP